MCLRELESGSLALEMLEITSKSLKNHRKSLKMAQFTPKMPQNGLFLANYVVK
jgi:hypothetical protein